MSIPLTLLCLFVFQDPSGDPPSPPAEPPQQPAPAEPSAEARPEPALVRPLSEDEVRTVLADFKEASRAKNANMGQRLQAIEALAAGSHEKLVKPLSTVVSKESALTLRRTAARALGHQPAPASVREIVRLLRDRDNHDEPNLVADLVGALDRAGYESKRDWEMLEEMFEKDFAEARRPLQTAILTLVANQGEVEALDLLLRHLEEPVPENPNSASNPPAEYWEARWKSWRTWRDEVRNGLAEITGQRFTTKSEAKTWIDANRKVITERQKARSEEGTR